MPWLRWQTSDREENLPGLAGEPVETRSLTQWRDRLATDAAGTTIEVGYERGGETDTTRLVLADLIPDKRPLAGR